MQFQHSANFVDDLKLSLDSEFLLESEVEIDETAEHFVHEIEVVGEGKFKFTEKFNWKLQQLPFDYNFILLYLTSHSVDPSRMDASSFVLNKQSIF